MSDLFLAGQRMSADKLTGSGFQFTYPTLEDAAKDLLA
jgi:NAD dependent epimerase/dehydratase family enzyme